MYRKEGFVIGRKELRSFRRLPRVSKVIVLFKMVFLSGILLYLLSWTHPCWFLYWCPWVSHWNKTYRPISDLDSLLARGNRWGHSSTVQHFCKRWTGRRKKLSNSSRCPNVIRYVTDVVNLCSSGGPRPGRECGPTALCICLSAVNPEASSQNCT